MHEIGSERGTWTAARDGPERYRESVSKNGQKICCRIAECGRSEKPKMKQITNVPANRVELQKRWHQRPCKKRTRDAKSSWKRWRKRERTEWNKWEMSQHSQIHAAIVAANGIGCVPNRDRNNSGEMWRRRGAKREFYTRRIMRIWASHPNR